ncbi:sensor histidine kinase [Hymenobacter arizonensis]|uniref:histidine kinase n=1 Tax=Hymenobacter arizonensis TaxID=1227077 RepID=A0A1I5XJ23_HYMAR|nr:ATP-binding protein [Hymenobacter arizonensis]SFQ31973.1 two-component system, OmpR family, sensor histidine kinase VicK [Hymenobacter arizonensis]
MTDFADFFVDQAAASSHVQFIYDVAADRVTFVNEAYEKALNGRCAHVNEELPALLARLHPDDRAYLIHYCKLWVRGQVSDEIEVRLQQPGQPDQWFCLTPHHQATNGRVLIGGVLRDISVAKRHQQNADNFSSRKNAALEILSHDLSGAFGIVQQVAQYLTEEVTVPANSRVGDMLRVLENTSRSSLKMIRDLVNMEFLSSANTDLKRDRVEVGTVLRAPLDELQRGQGTLGHAFEYSLPTEPLYVNLDVNKITQVLANLVSNAFKFTPDGKRVAVAVEPCPGCVRIRVIDEGIGIPAALQPQLFERFTKARRQGLRGEQTTGLGLALCKFIVEWHGGTISVDSAEGVGTTFTVEIPQAESEIAAL